MESYEEIWGRMKAAYTAKSGWAPEDVSDLGLRLQLLAGELYRLQAGIEWLKRQAFPQTADGAQLDMHGAQRGVVRRGQEKARGRLAFSRYVPAGFDLLIPKGTVCASYGEEAVEYETTADVTLAAGTVTVEAPAQAAEGGSRGNAAAGYVNTLVTEVNGINYVTNPAPFTGGMDPERDGDYRARVLESYRLMGPAGSAAWYEAVALEEEGVSDAQAVPREGGAGTVGVYVWGQGAAPGQAAMDALAEKLEGLREAGVAVTVKAPTVKKVGVIGYLGVKPGTVFAQAKEAAIQGVRDWFGQRKIGEGMYLSDLTRAVLDADPAICKVTFNSSTTAVEGAAGVLLALGAVAFSEG
ncbi:baseplate J/gp47 family protein [Acutalibacter caecimuris]|uniref:baseplate J/gp47 family protein n=1 Tax=Acutalibacter caecimuris TaxID=3093657 RepID=UPI002AC9CDE7|nr:baseplate J/gp47 family protein [Acutalibacter sp. M00118]